MIKNSGQKEKWEILKSEKIYSDPWIKLRKDTILRPNGVAGTYSVAEIKGGIGVVALNSENKIYLVGQYRYTVDRYSWEIPQGAFSNFEHTDDPLATAQRELKEETGITASKWRKLGFIHTLLGSTTDEVHLYLAEELTLGNPHPDDTENFKILLVTFEEFYKMFDDNKITDAASITGVILSEKMIKSSKS